MRGDDLNVLPRPAAIRLLVLDAHVREMHLTNSLRKWMRLALKGNPTILLLLFTPDDQLVHCDSLGRELRNLAPQIISRRVQGPYLGYLQAQKERLTGERGQKRIHRPELEEMYGFDTKYAMHMLRLGFQGVELLKGPGGVICSWMVVMPSELAIERTVALRITPAANLTLGAVPESR